MSCVRAMFEALLGMAKCSYSVQAADLVDKARLQLRQICERHAAMGAND